MKMWMMAVAVTLAAPGLAQTTPQPGDPVAATPPVAPMAPDEPGQPVPPPATRSAVGNEPGAPPATPTPTPTPPASAAPAPGEAQPMTATPPQSVDSASLPKCSRKVRDRCIQPSG